MQTILLNGASWNPNYSFPHHLTIFPFAHYVQKREWSTSTCLNSKHHMQWSTMTDKLCNLMMMMATMIWNFEMGKQTKWMANYWGQHQLPLDCPFRVGSLQASHPTALCHQRQMHRVSLFRWEQRCEHSRKWNWSSLSVLPVPSLAVGMSPAPASAHWHADFPVRKV